MFSLQKLLGKGDQFFDLFEASAQKSCDAVEHLKLFLKDPSNRLHLKNLREARLENKRISQEIDQLLVRSFVTILEREDIEILIRALYKIPKPLEKFAEMFSILHAKIEAEPFESQVATLDTAATLVLRMVKELRAGNNLGKVKGLNARLQEVEAEADEIELKLLGELYNSNQDALGAMAKANLFDLLEKVVDLCRDAGNVITHIFLKNS